MYIPEFNHYLDSTPTTPPGDLLCQQGDRNTGLRSRVSRDQVRTQLAIYKEAKYGNSQIELFANDDDLMEEGLRRSLLVETHEFVTKTIM